MARAAIIGVTGIRLSSEEAAFLEQQSPWGIILFTRNLESPEQIRLLCQNIREALGRNAPIFIDQEGGRVARLTSPMVREWPPALDHVRDAADPAREMGTRFEVISVELLGLGIDANCAPVLDIAGPETHPFLRNRCYGEDPETVARIGRAVAEAQVHSGVIPVIKHAPGHGRASADSHLGLPLVAADRGTLRAEAEPFAALRTLPAMTSHCLYPCLDPDRPGTISPLVVAFLRDDIGLSGLLMTDDLGMGALGGTPGDRAAASFAAGVDIALFGNGTLAENHELLAACPVLAGDALARAEAALAIRKEPAHA